MISTSGNRGVWPVLLLALGLAVYGVLSVFTTGATECASAATCNGGSNLVLDGSLTVNDDGEAFDIRLESDGNENLLDTDGTNDRLAIGADASSQSELFTVAGASTFTGEINTGSSPGPGSAGEVLASQGAGSAPEWSSLGAIGSTAYAVKTADESDLTAPVQDDNHLVFSVDANSYYAFELTLKLLAGGASNNLVVDFSEPSGTEWDCVWVWYEANPAAERGGLNQSEATGERTLATPAVAHASCVADTAGTAGSIQFRWYGTGSGAGYTLEEGSWISHAKLS